MENFNMTKYNPELLRTLEDRFDKLQAYLFRAFDDDDDLYSFIASIMYDKSEDECRDLHPDGSPNPEGKELRNRAKQFILPIALEFGSIFTPEYETEMDAKLDAANLRATSERCKKCEFTNTCEFNPSECEE